MKYATDLKTLRKKALNDTIGLPKRAYHKMPNGMLVAVNSTRATYLMLKKEARKEANK